MSVYKLLLLILPIIYAISCINENDLTYKEKSTQILRLKDSYKADLTLLYVLREYNLAILDSVRLINKNKELAAEEKTEIEKGLSFIHFSPTTEQINNSKNIIEIINDIFPAMTNVIEFCDKYLRIYCDGEEHYNLAKTRKHSKFVYSELNEIENQIDIMSDLITKRIGQPTINDFIELNLELSINK